MRALNSNEIVSLLAVVCDGLSRDQTWTVFRNGACVSVVSSLSPFTFFFCLAYASSSSSSAKSRAIFAVASARSLSRVHWLTSLS